jgi:hypothetical protein
MYYPKSKITPNLYTSGEEYQIFTSREEYIGYYYKTSNGKFYTGKNPQDKPNLVLVPIQNLNDNQNSSPAGGDIDTDILLYNSVEEGYETYTTLNFFKYPKNNDFKPRRLPTYNPTLPTDKDKTLGVFTRYFCKKTNELLYIEIDKLTYSLIQDKDPRIAWDLYNSIPILWQIQGDKEKTYKANKNNTMLTEQKFKWHGFSKYLKEDYLKYYLGS